METIHDAPPAVAAVTAPETSAPRRRRKLPGIGVMFAIAWIGVLGFLAAFADFLPFIRAYDQRARYATNYKVGPGSDFWFGSDGLGRDVFARCIYGARISLLVVGASILTGVAIGGFLGVLAGFRRGVPDRIISVATDALLALPALIMAILVVGRLDALQASSDLFGWLNRTWSVLFILSLLSIAPLSRIVRAQTLSLANREFVLAARSLGAKNKRIIFREIVPNLVPAMVSVAFTGIAVLLIAEGGLAFLGYSVEIPTPTWGFLINEARPQIARAWWATLFPCFMLFFTVLAFNIVGDRLARRFDIREAAL